VEFVIRCHGLDKLWKWNVGVFVYIVMNDGALKAGKKLYISVCGLCVARDIRRRAVLTLCS
jgi:hypothetical protein